MIMIATAGCLFCIKLSWVPIAILIFYPVKGNINITASPDFLKLLITMHKPAGGQFVVTEN